MQVKETQKKPRPGDGARPGRVSDRNKMRLLDEAAVFGIGQWVQSWTNLELLGCAEADRYAANVLPIIQEAQKA
jgi:hypothetical protein